MSYSFSVTAKDKTEALERVEEELAKVVLAQPVHAEDRFQAKHAADAFIRLLASDLTKDIVISMNGSIWKSEAGVRQASVYVSAALVDKKGVA